MSSKIKPVLHYDFEHFTEDGKVEDLSGNGYHGTISGATRCEDMWGNPNSAMVTAAGATCVYNLNMESVLYGSEFTLIITMKVPTWASWKDLFSFTKIDDDKGFKYETTSNIGTIARYSTGLAGGDTPDIITNIPVDKWFTISVTYDNNIISSYLNDSLMEYVSATGDFNAKGIHFGNDIYLNRGITSVFNEAKIYTNSLTPTQVKHISAQMMRKIGRQ
jgi:hypothetical protein